MTDAATRQDREWRVISEDVRDGPTNMALDEVAARTAAQGGPRTIRVYRWAPSTLSLGYSQDPTTIDWDACADRGIAVTRRPTGGGAIYHDEYGDVSYSIVAPAEELPGDLMDSYHLLCAPILGAFEAIGLDVAYTEDDREALYHPACYLRALHPAHDMVGPTGKKIAGNAQYRRRDAIVHHGSLTYARDPGTHLACFATTAVTPDAFRERVTGVTDHVDLHRDAFVAAVTDALTTWADATAGGWTAEERAAAEELAQQKYRAPAWVREGVDPT
ncbi:MAG: biotin/lipoate A/B protein ligase family protein [Halobacteriaceae archaeon]